MLTRPRDTAGVANDVAEMRRAIALEKGEDDLWDLKYAAGGLVDIDFIAQYLQLVHAAARPDILDVSTLQVLDNAARLGVLPQASAEILRAAALLYHDLTQILRLCVSERFKPESAGVDLLRVMARAGDAPDFSSLQARVKETQARCGGCFARLSRAADLLSHHAGDDRCHLLVAFDAQMKPVRQRHARLPQHRHISSHRIDDADAPCAQFSS